MAEKETGFTVDLSVSGESQEVCQSLQVYLGSRTSVVEISSQPIGIVWMLIGFAGPGKFTNVYYCIEIILFLEKAGGDGESFNGEVECCR